MTKTYDIAAFRALIGAIKCEDNPVLVKQKSRDFYWYSPVLKRELEHVTADLVVSPRSEAEVATVLAAAHKLGVPVTPRGAGTGNYGQAMPLTGGVLLNLIEMNTILDISPGRVVAEPGALLIDIDKAAAPSGQELRMFPSTRATASIGGFIAGGSGGVGSITWGGLRDFGNVLRLRVMTMESEPRTLELTGADLHKAVHAYGTNGVITEVEAPLTAAYDWVDVIVGFDSFDAAAAYGYALGQQDGILKKLVTVVAAPAPSRYFLRHRAIIPEGKSVVLAMVAPHALDALEAFTRPVRGAGILFVSSRAAKDTLTGLPPNYELAWNHTTLRALRVDPAITYLQIRYPEDRGLSLISRIHEIFRDEVLGHLEIIRFNGRVGFAGLPMVRFSTEERLQEIMNEHEAMGAMVFNPHRYTLEEGGMKQTDATQLAFKRETDPQGLLNPGKMIAWEDPAFDYSAGKNFLFPGLEARALAAQV
ncbi:FAD-binding oxidoreductase [Roseiarcus sp.]|uniref:FAD-binding oxidoreductase n=1 Tax=Roseiarcus sp. TaxID=1969460 RepID=UPI003F9D1BED